MDGQTLFGRRLRSLREVAGVSREKAAEAAEINANYLGEIERGEKWPSIEVIQRLADALKVSPSLFFEFEAEEVDQNVLRSRLIEILVKRNTEQLQLAMRVLRALFPV
jgi:transcriptional regulator with XRE-family HTH domain